MKILKVLGWIFLFPFMLTYWGWKNSKKLAMYVGIALSVLFLAAGAFSDDELVTEVPVDNAQEQHIESNLVDDNEVSDKIETVDNSDNTSNESSDVENDKNTEDTTVDNKDTDSTESKNGDTSESNDNSAKEIAEKIAEEADIDNPDVVFVGTKDEPPTDTASEITNDDTELVVTGFKSIEVYGGDLSGHREPNVVVDIGFGDRHYYAFTNEYGQLFRVVAKEIILQDDSTEPVLSTGRYYPDEAKVPGTESSSLDEGHHC